jgi:hypothetical protein
MIYGSDFTEYDVFRHSNGLCVRCCTPLNNSGMCICCEYLSQTKPMHIAAEIYHQWQLEKSRGWRWNNAHRRGIDLFQFKNVPIHHRSIYPEVDRFYWVLSNDEQKLAKVIASVLVQRRREKYKQQRNARKWKRNWLWEDDSDSSYDKWMYDRPRTKLMTYAIEAGLTYRHLRRRGYIPYIEEALQLQEETLNINRTATNRMLREIEETTGRHFDAV